MAKRRSDLEICRDDAVLNLEHWQAIVRHFDEVIARRKLSRAGGDKPKRTRASKPVAVEKVG